MGFVPDEQTTTLEKPISRFIPDKPTKTDSKTSKVDIGRTAIKEAVSAIVDTTKPRVDYMMFQPIEEIAQRVTNSIYQEAKKPYQGLATNIGRVSPVANLVDAIRGNDKAKNFVGNQVIDASAFTLAGSGVKLGQLSKDFLSTKPFASDQELVSNIVKNSREIYKKTVELLRPEDISYYFEREKTHPAVVEMTNIIKKSDSPETAIRDTNNTINRIFGERARLLAEKNKPMEGSHLVDLSKYIESERANGTSTETQLKAMDRVLYEESNRYEPSKFDLLSAESKKEFYQGMSERVYEHGGVDELTSGASKAYAKLAESTKKLIEKSVPEIAEINSRYDGLKKGRELLAKVQAKLVENPTDTLQAFTDTAGRPSKQSAMAAAVRKIPFVRDIGSYKRFSGKIEKLRNEGNALRTIIENRIKASR